MHSRLEWVTHSWEIVGVAAVVATQQDPAPRGLAAHRDHLGVARELKDQQMFGHAVLEAAILATRIEFLPAESILSDFERLSIIVDKTAGDDEIRAFQFLSDYVQTALTTKTD